MINGKVGGIMIGGLAGFLLINKAINFLENSVSNICSAAKWKAYYKNCKDPLVVPPGYASSTRKISDDEELVVEDPNLVKREENSEKTSDAVKEAIDAVVNCVKTCCGKKKDAEQEDINSYKDELQELREEMKIKPEEQVHEDPVTEEGEGNNDQTVD